MAKVEGDRLTVILLWLPKSAPNGIHLGKIQIGKGHNDLFVVLPIFLVENGASFVEFIITIHEVQLRPNIIHQPIDIAQMFK